jgi:hypothetical protein
MASRKVARDDPKMRGQRARTVEGTLRRKRGDTRADTIERTYGIDLGVRGDKKLSKVLKDERVTTLTIYSRRSDDCRGIFEWIILTVSAE